MAVPSFRPTRRWLASTVALVSTALAQAPPPTPYHPEWHRAPFLNLTDARTVATRYAGGVSLTNARALSTAVADFDEDGMPDLAAGFKTSGGAGAVAIHRGNVDALWPYGALRGTVPPAFLPDARVFSLPQAPDFLAAGDFDADGHWDIVAAHRGSNTLWLLKGDGHGGFAGAQRIVLPGSVTAMTSGEINRADGLTDLMVAVTGGAGPQALVFESPNGALHATQEAGTPEAFDLPADASALAVIPLDGGLMNGLAIAAGHNLLLIHGRDRRLTRSKAERERVPEATVTRQTFPFVLRSLAVGNFTSPTLDLAALGGDGQIHILERSDANQRLGTPRFSVAGAATAVAPRQAIPRSPGPPPMTARMKTTGMTESRAIALPLSVSHAGNAGAKLVTARIAATSRDSLIVVDPAGGKLHVVSHSSRTDATSMAVSASLNVAGGAPAAVQAMRINKDPLSDLVVLTSAQSQPIAIETSPAYIVTVTNTSDSGAGSLRQAINFSGSLGSAEIDFNIPVTDPDRDPTTGVFTIQPVGLNEYEALPGVPGNVTIDAYTQPGATPNTLVMGDNAHPLIELNGSMAGIGPSGFEPGGDTIRGFAITNFVEAPVPSENGTTGGAGIDIETSFNYIEGNFFGIDAGGTFAKPSYLGVISFDGIYGNVIGGTTAQARNIFGDSNYASIGIAAAATPNSYLIEGNYVGTDKTGTVALNNGLGGVGLSGYNAVVGGTAAGAGNLISGNSSENVNLEPGCSEDCEPFGGNLVQGNYIGTDLTGTHRLPYLIDVGVYLVAANGDTIGGTTPAARNIISGNATSGVDLTDGSGDIVIEGNYIGLDVTGTQAVANGSAGVTFALEYCTSISTCYPGAPAVSNLIGGEAAGAANVISANIGGGISIASASGDAQNNVIAGNLIGTDASGVNPLGNQGDGILMQTYAASNTVGGTAPGAGNVIAYNTGNGVNINPGSGVASNNSVVGNTIFSNSGAGVRIPSGTGNTVSHNDIYSNAALGIDIDAAGVLVNSACQANASGANLLQDAPVLTAGTGSTFVSATATDPHGNTSEFSNCVATSLAGNVLTIAGTLNSTPSTTYTIEYFSNTSCDASGYGQGQDYLGSTTVTTGSNCTAPVGGTLNLNSADLAVAYPPLSYALTNQAYYFTALVSNNGPALATAATLTDVLATGITYLSATATQGACSFAAGTITCNLGNMPTGTSVTVSVYIVPTMVGSFSNTVTVASSAPDANMANNSATFTKTAQYLPELISLTPIDGYVGIPSVITLVGQGFTANSVVTYGGVVYPATFNPNWNPSGCPVQAGAISIYCTALTITVPGSQLTSVATVQVGVQASATLPFYVIATAPPVPGPVAKFVLSGIPSPFAGGNFSELAITAEDANGILVPTYSGTVNLTSSDPAFYVVQAGGGNSVPFPAADGGVLDASIWLQTFGTQSITATDASNPPITGTIGGIVVGPGVAANLTLSGSPQATPPDHAFALPLSVTVTDENGNLVPNQVVTFTAPTSGASAVLSSSTATTNAQGVASVTATANSTSGAYAVGVTAGAGTNSGVFLLNNGAGLATLTATAGSGQSTPLGQLFATGLQATLLDGLGNPISGATVYFTSGVVNGAFAVLTNPATNASGVATTNANAPLNASPGTFPVTASAGGLTATYTLTEVAGAPVVVTITGGAPQTTAISTPFGTPLAVQVTNYQGHPLSGVVVTYNPPASGASAALSAGTVSTDFFGNASLTATANSTLGTYNVTAAVDGVTVSFALTNGPPQGSGPAASIAAATGTPQSQSVNTAFAAPLKALVKDASGSPLSGASVTFTAPATGPSGTFGGSASVTVISDGNGNATAPTFTANTTVGSYLVTAKTGALSTTFSLTNTPGACAGLAAYSGNNQSATINTNFGTPLAVEAVDAYGNSCGAAAANLSVIFAADAGNSGASATANGSTSVTPNSTGIATAPSLTANGTAGAFNVTALLFVYTPTFQDFVQVFTLTNTASTPAILTAVSGTPQSTAVTTAFPVALSAKVTDSGNNPLAGFTVNFAAPPSGAGAALSAPSAITNSSGIAAVNAIANIVDGSYNVTASIGSLSAAFGLTNTGVVANRCDVNLDATVNVLDVQREINEALGAALAANDLNSDGLVNVVDVQIVIDSALGLGCSAH